jgi:hypothetical protein
MTIPTTYAFSGDFVDIKFIKGRKVCQIWIELPIEAGTQFIHIFGAPDPSKNVQCAIAKLDPTAKSAAVTAKPTSMIEEKPKKKWDELSLTQRAGILCEEGGFQMFLKEEYPKYWELCNGDVAEVVRQICEIQSRAELDTNNQAGNIFTDLEAEYRAWRLVAG